MKGRSVLLLALAACNRDPVSADAQTPVSTVSAAPVAPAADPPPAKSPPLSSDEVAEPGTGSCRADDECVVSSYQSGCCTQACAPGAWSKAELARATAGEDCTKPRTSPCPPPSPCPVQTFDVVRALCQSGTCAAVKKPRAGKP